MNDPRALDVDMSSVVPLIREILAVGGTTELTVSGNSMRPLFKHRVSRVRLAVADTYAPGDVVLYQRDNGAFVLHRILQIKGGLFVMRGDNQYLAETGIRQDQILAAMTAFTRDGVHWHKSGCILHRIYRTFWVRSCPVRRRCKRMFDRLFSMIYKRKRP